MNISLVDLVDCHVHVDEIKIYHPAAAKKFGKNIGAVLWRGATIEQHVKHIQQDNLESIFAIYENWQSILNLRKAAPHCDIRAMLFVRDIESIDESQLLDLHRRVLLQAIKLHPVIDDYDLSVPRLSKVLEIARRFRLPILYHSDDRKLFMDRTSPNLQEKLVSENKDIIFIIGHGGAYAHARICGSNPSVSGYWNGSGASYSRKTLIIKALQLAAKYENVYYDCSVATNPIKASLIAQFLQKNCIVSEKILIGTDFPIGFASAQTQLYALENAGLRKKLLEKIASNRLL